ncbi:MAG: type IX secretion system membrane protein PorP/SprF [Flavobacteriales bacterium]|nr:type IX secretion system membrane protein PorP/SprF [Flavobacteriales bacterium]
MLTLLFCIADKPSQAQQEWGYSQYLFNLYDINSSYAGNHNGPSFAARYRSQWMGFEGAPVTQLFSFHTPVAHDQIGLGMKILNESIGARKQQQLKISGSYRMHFGENTLAFGVAGGAVRQSSDISMIKAADEQDAQLSVFPNTSITPIVDASVFFNTKKFYVGIESTRLNKSAYHHEQGALARLYYNVNATAGYIQKIGENNLLQLSSMMKYSEGKLWQADLNLTYLINNKLWFGGGYRVFSGALIVACINITEHFRLGLSYDVAAKKMRTNNDGSAEVYLGYHLINRSSKSIRYF